MLLLFSFSNQLEIIHFFLFDLLDVAASIQYTSTIPFFQLIMLAGIALGFINV